MPDGTERDETELSVIAKAQVDASATNGGLPIEPIERDADEGEADASLDKRALLSLFLQHLSSR